MSEIFHYLIDDKIEILEENELNELWKVCVSSSNYELLSALEGKDLKINKNIINEEAKIGNLFLIKYFLENNQIPKDILQTPTASGNAELVKFILQREKIDINAKTNEIYFNN